jgi:magnesium transporter
MFRILELNADGRVVATEKAESVQRPGPGASVWVDLDSPVEEALEMLRQGFGFHPLALEDCAHLDQRPKLEEYGDHLFLVVQGFSCVGDRVNELVVHELHAFLGESWLVTVHASSIPALEAVWQRAASDPSQLKRGADFIYYLIADTLVDKNFPILDRVADELEELEDRVLSNAQRSDLARIFELKRHLVTMRKVLSPQRDTMAMLARRGDARVSERTSLYFRDVYDHLSRINESIEANRDLLGNALDAYLSSVSNRTNEIMKHLTLLSAVFLPLAFVVGFFGQNFHELPGMPSWMDSKGLMYVMVGICLATPLTMVLWFRKRGWF